MSSVVYSRQQLYRLVLGVFIGLLLFINVQALGNPEPGVNDLLSCKNSIEEPRITLDEAPQNQTILAGQGVSFDCAVFSTPQATVQWLHNDAVVNEEPSDQYERLVNRGQPTLGTAVTRSAFNLGCVDQRNAGTYTCVVQNGCSTKTYKAILHVQGTQRCGSKDRRARSAGSAAEIVMWTDTRLEHTGAAAQLFCRAQGIPRPRVKWMHIMDEQTGTTADIAEGPQIFQLASGDLFVGAGYAKGAGGLAFRCVAENEHGTDEKDVVFVEVNVE